MPSQGRLELCPGTTAHRAVDPDMTYNRPYHDDRSHYFPVRPPLSGARIGKTREQSLSVTLTAARGE
jgi:hypothetical protein